jgi:hypothetical protein
MTSEIPLIHVESGRLLGSDIYTHNSDVRAERCIQTALIPGNVEMRINGI